MAAASPAGPIFRSDGMNPPGAIPWWEHPK